MVTMRLVLEAMVTIVMALVLVLLEMMVLRVMVLLLIVLGVMVTMTAASAHLADDRSPLYPSRWVS